MYSFFLRFVRTIGNALLYGMIFSLIIGGIAYASAGTKFISLAGINFVDFFVPGQSDGTAGVNASAIHTMRNDTWIPFPGDNQNYIRGTTNFQYGNVRVADSLCLGGVCRNSWPTSSIPAGAIMAFNLSSCPSGWVAANGTNGTPDLRGEFIRGLDSGRGVDNGRSLGSWQNSQNLWHDHSGNTNESGWHTHNIATNFLSTSVVNQPYRIGGDDGAWNNFVNNVSTDWAGGHSHNFTTSGNGGSEARPRNVALLYCQKQ